MVRPADRQAETGRGRDRRRRRACDATQTSGTESCSTSPEPRIPTGDVDAPARFLPMWDSLLLAHADRTRLIGEAHRQVVTARNGDTLPTFLVNGRVAGLWWAEADGSSSRIVLEPFVRLEPGRPTRRSSGKGSGSPPSSARSSPTSTAAIGRAVPVHRCRRYRAGPARPPGPRGRRRRRRSPGPAGSRTARAP